MGDAASITTSLLTEHLRYTPLSLVDDIINSINAIVYKAVEAVEKGLLGAKPASLGFSQAASDSNASDSIPDTDGDGNVLYPEARQEIETGVHELETLLEATVDKTFDKLEIVLLRSVLKVPEEMSSWIRLGHYENLSFAQQADAPTPESIMLQRRKLQETQKLHTALLAESSRNAAIIAQLRSVLSPTVNSNSLPRPKPEDGETERVIKPENTTAPFAFMMEGAAVKDLGATCNGQQPLNTTTNFAISQLPALRSLLSTLRPKLATLPKTSSNDYDSTREERRYYIESQTRRHIERTRGLELEVQGQIRDGEWQGNGRRVGTGEMGALEDVVGMLGPGVADREAVVDGQEDVQMED
ncbi:MAG: hypothetical protein M1827_006094 [Pycnora praestabilis]|nr:MAG: hypothetical protein M1827_006094 [Pycnora praestabilis]